MPSPRNSSPALSRSFATSLLNERSAIRVPLPPPLRALLCGPQLTQPHATAIIFERTYHIGSLLGEGNTMRSTFIAGAVVIAAASAAPAQDVTLRVVSAFAEGTEFSRNFERFVEKVNADGKGLIKINYIGGPRAVPPFEVGNAVRTRVVDMANVTGAFYTNLMPEADGFKLNGKPMSEQRKNGTWEFINELHNQKLNSQYLARQFRNVPFHIYLNKQIEKIDFSGLKIRVTPVYRDVVEALGGAPITTAPGEVYTALERGVVDVLVNLDAWKGLNDAQRKVLDDAALWLEGLDSEKDAVIKAERERQAAAGIQALDFGPAASKAFLDRAYEVAWQSVIKRAPETGPKLRQLAGN